MKRKFILLPITLTALTPAISLAGCGGLDVPSDPLIEGQEVDFNNLTEDEEGTFTLECEPFALEEGKAYTAVADLSKITKTQESNILTFFNLTPLNTLEDDISIRKIVVNGKQLNETTYEEKDKGGWFFTKIGELTTLLMVSTKGSKFKMESNVYITFAANNATKPLNWRIRNAT